jgi:hypothetical protein
MIATLAASNDADRRGPWLVAQGPRLVSAQTQQRLTPQVTGGQPHLVLQQMCQRPKPGTLKQRRPNGDGRFTQNCPPPTWTQGEHKLSCGTTALEPPADVALCAPP